MEKKKKLLNTKYNIFLILILIILIVYAVSLLLPIIWTMYTSLKGREDFMFNNKLKLPEKIYFANFIIAYQNFKILIITNTGSRYIMVAEMFFNSAVYSLGCMISATMAPLIMSYLCSKYKSKLSKIIYNIVIITMIVPIVGALPSEIQMTRILGLYDTFVGVWILRLNFCGLYFLIFYAAFLVIPWTYAESAFIDGASHTRVFFLIMIPLVSKTIYTILLLNFINFWNDFQIPMVYIPSMPTAAFGAYMFQFSQDNIINSVPIRLAGSMLLTLPILILFIIFNKKLLGSMTMGGLKG